MNEKWRKEWEKKNNLGLNNAFWCIIWAIYDGGNVVGWWGWEVGSIKLWGDGLCWGGEGCYNSLLLSLSSLHVSILCPHFLALYLLTIHSPHVSFMLLCNTPSPHSYLIFSSCLPYLYLMISCIYTSRLQSCTLVYSLSSHILLSEFALKLPSKSLRWTSFAKTLEMNRSSSKHLNSCTLTVGNFGHFVRLFKVITVVVAVRKNKPTVSVTVTNPCEIVHSHTLWPNKNAKLHYLLVKQLHTNSLSIWHLWQTPGLPGIHME